MSANDLRVLDNLFESSNFDGVVNHFINNGLTASHLISSYKRRNKKRPQLFEQPEFWQSRLPLFHLNEVLQSDLKSAFLHKYFSSGRHVNDDLNAYLFLAANETFVSYFKRNRAFLHPEFVKSLSNLSKEISGLQQLAQESNILLSEWTRIKNQQEKDDHLILGLDLDEFLLGVTLYYQNVKYNPKLIQNKAGQFEIENVALKLIDRGLGLHANKNMTLAYPSNTDLQKDFERYRPAHPLLEQQKALYLPPNKLFKLVSDIADRFLDRTIRNNLIELYQCGYADFVSTSLTPALLKPNDKLGRFRMNDHKKGPEEFYFSDPNINEYSEFTKPSVRASLKMFEFYGIPKNFNIAGEEIDMEKVMILLQHFSAYKGPTERWIIPGNSVVVKNEPNSRFHSLLGGNESISLFSTDALIAAIAEYFEWSSQETQTTVQFLAYDIEKHNLQEWFYRPFLKLNRRILWLGAFLKDRRWSYVLLNKLKNEKIPKSVTDKIGSNLEKRLSNVFKDAGFLSTQGLEYRKDKKVIGDLDVAVFKDNHLFICEVKSGERSHDFSYASYTELVKLEEKASTQLNRALRNTHLFRQDLQKELGIEIDWDKVKIIPMIVTDIFEGDLQLYAENIRKVSLLELDVILKNNKRQLLEEYFTYQAIHNAHGFKHQDISNWDLWNGEKELNPEWLLNIIDNNRVWAEFMKGFGY